MDKVADIRGQLPDDQDIYNLAEFFKMFGNPTRAKILHCLHLSDLYVGEIAEVLGMIIKLKPAAAKGSYVKSIYLSTTMSPGLQIDSKSVETK